MSSVQCLKEITIGSPRSTEMTTLWSCNSLHRPALLCTLALTPYILVLSTCALKALCYKVGCMTESLQQLNYAHLLNKTWQTSNAYLSRKGKFTPNSKPASPSSFIYSRPPTKLCPPSRSSKPSPFIKQSPPTGYSNTPTPKSNYSNVLIHILQ